MRAYVSLCMTVLFPADISKKSQLTFVTYFYLFMYLWLMTMLSEGQAAHYWMLGSLSKHHIAQKVAVALFQVLTQQQPFFYGGFLTNAEIVGLPWLGHNHFLWNTLGCIIHKSTYHLVQHSLGYCSVMSYIKR